MTELDRIFEPIQAEYDGGEPMLPGTIPQAKAQILALIDKRETEARVGETQRWLNLAIETDGDAILLNTIRRQFKDRIKTLSAKHSSKEDV